MSSKAHDVVVIGGGIVGLATARALARTTRASIVVLEAEDRLATHQTGHNSGVIHSGLYYEPGSLKARTCAEGREAMYRFCEEHGIAHERCGKLVVAADEGEIATLHRLLVRGEANGLDGLRRLTGGELRELEPHVRGVAGIHVPQTGIVDFGEVACALANDARAAGVEIVTGARVDAVDSRASSFVVRWDGGELETRNLVASAGLQCDRLARLCGLRPGVRVVPFRGEYYELLPERRHLVRNPIYPVPDPRLPFLGVHLTRTIHGAVEAGPNAAPAWKREGYDRFSFSARDTAGTLAYGGFWRLAFRYWRTGLAETGRSYSKPVFARALRRLVPEIRSGDLRRCGAGVRAQAVRPDGTLVDDFHVVDAPRMLHVINAPSPAATASLAIGRNIAGRARKAFDLEGAW